jgi:hypothetical protein
MTDITPKMLREQIIDKQRRINLLRFEINAIAENYIDDFSFLKYKISTEWICDDSPVGMCVFELDREGRTLNCRYCNEPEERK